MTHCTKYAFPGLHCCLTAQNSTGAPHSFAYVSNDEYSQGEASDDRVSAAKAVSIYLQQLPRSCKRTCVFCASVFKVSVVESTAYDPAEEQSGALTCITCLGGLDNDGQNLFVCSE